MGAIDLNEGVSDKTYKRSVVHDWFLSDLVGSSKLRFQNEHDCSAGRDCIHRGAEARRVKDPDWQAKVRAVEEIEKLRAKHDALRFAELEGPAD